MQARSQRGAGEKPPMQSRLPPPLKDNFEMVWEGEISSHFTSKIRVCHQKSYSGYCPDLQNSGLSPKILLWLLPERFKQLFKLLQKFLNLILSKVIFLTCLNFQNFHPQYSRINLMTQNPFKIGQLKQRIFFAHFQQLFKP